MPVRQLAPHATITTTAHQQLGSHLEVYPRGADHRRRELVLRETRHEARFAHAGVAQQQDANGVVEVISLSRAKTDVTRQTKKNKKQKNIRVKLNFSRWKAKIEGVKKSGSESVRPRAQVSS